MTAQELTGGIWPPPRGGIRDFKLFLDHHSVAVGFSPIILLREERTSLAIPVAKVRDVTVSASHNSYSNYIH